MKIKKFRTVTVVWLYKMFKKSESERDNFVTGLKVKV